MYIFNTTTTTTTTCYEKQEGLFVIKNKLKN